MFADSFSTRFMSNSKILPCNMLEITYLIRSQCRISKDDISHKLTKMNE
jgi:hypothetical protein